MTRTVFESLGWLFAPPDHAADCALVEAPSDWRGRLPPNAPAVVWGRLPARGLPLSRAVRFAVAREGSLRALRNGAQGLRLWGVHRIAPIGWRSRWQRAIRHVLLSGAFVRLGRGPAQSRIADRVAAAAGDPRDAVDLRISGDGSARAHLTLAGGRRVILRLATVGGLKEAARNVEGLRALGEAGVAKVPRLHDAGRLLEVDWSTEDELPGRPIHSVAPGILAEVVEWAATLPRSGAPALAVEERLERIAREFPRSAGHVGAALNRVRAQAKDVPGILAHGDLWAGNLLVGEAGLTGVVDWDNWHPAGVPGSDLLHLLTMAGRRGRAVELGQLWLDRPWQRPEFREVTAPYWRALGIPLDDELAWLAGVDWWAAHITAGLRRGRQPARDPRWVALNVENVAPRLASGS